MGGTGGLNPKCQALLDGFDAALAQAKQCSPMVNSLQCTTEVGDDIQCPCPTFVNPANTAALATLDQLESEWKKAGCNQGLACAGVACPAPQGSGCVPDGAGADSGTCQDFWPD